MYYELPISSGKILCYLVVMAPPLIPQDPPVELTLCEVIDCFPSLKI